MFRHIEYLLLAHDHVIIPQLGGFVASTMPSVWSESEELYFPPYRTVHFNASLDHGDHTLADSLCTAYSITPAEAEKRCAQFVQQVRLELADSGSLDFGTIGVMIQECPDGPITFSPCKAGVTTPSLYGLDAFHIAPLQAHVVQPTPATPRKALRLSPSALHTIGVVAASLVLFFLSTIPAGMPSQHTATHQAQMTLPTDLLDTFQATPAEEEEEEVFPEEVEVSSEQEDYSEEETTVAEDNSPLPIDNEPATQVEATDTPEPAMAIVLASAISQTRAERYAIQLQARGMDAHVYQRGKMVRVIVPCYSTENEAWQQLRQIQQSSPEFAQAWITSLE